MENNFQLSSNSHPQEFENAIIKACLDRFEQEKKEDQLVNDYRNQFKQIICNAIAKKIGRMLPYEEAINTPLRNKDWCEILDEVFNEQDCLIKASNELKPYSLVRKKTELKEYVPIQFPNSPLDLLRDKSTSRALEIINEQTSENTYRAHLGDLVYWEAWRGARNFSLYEPISLDNILDFIVQHAEGIDSEVDKKLVEQNYKNKLGPHKLSTIKRRVASLSVFLELVKWPNPCNEKEVKELLYKLTKKYGSSKPAGKAITKDILDDMIETCSDKLIDKRDKALLLFAWGSGGRRRNEVVSANMANLTETVEGDFTYLMAKSKTDQEQNGYVVPVKGRVARALKDWISAASINHGAIFRSVTKGNAIGSALSDIDVYRIVKRRLKKAGYDETQYGAHSLRSGFVTEAGRRGKPLGDVMALTTHKNVSTVMRYYQAGNINNNSAADLAD